MAPDMAGLPLPPDTHAGQHGDDCPPCFLATHTPEEILASGDYELVPAESEAYE